MPNDKTRIAELLNNICQKDDQKSFEEFFQIFYERLLKFCMAYIHDKAHAEEIVSGVFLKLWLKRNELPEIQNPETYLFVAVKNQSLNFLKQFSNYRVVFMEESGVHELVGLSDVASELEKKELFFRLNQAIETLPGQCKIIFMLVKEEGMKYKEVARILDISPRTVETQLVRAMKKLSKVLTPYADAYSKTSKKQRGNLKTLRMLFSLFHF